MSQTINILFLAAEAEPFVKVGALADGVIVGSACVKTIGGSEHPVEAARKFAVV